MERGRKIWPRESRKDVTKEMRIRNELEKTEENLIQRKAWRK